MYEVAKLAHVNYFFFNLHILLFKHIYKSHELLSFTQSKTL